jgi:hypothetical protein
LYKTKGYGCGTKEFKIFRCDSVRVASSDIGHVGASKCFLASQEFRDLDDFKFKLDDSR